MIQMEESSEVELNRLNERIKKLTGDKKSQDMKIKSQTEQSELKVYFQPALISTMVAFIVSQPYVCCND